MTDSQVKRYIYLCSKCETKFSAWVNDPYEEDPCCPKCGEGVATLRSMEIDVAGVLPLGRV